MIGGAMSDAVKTLKWVLDYHEAHPKVRKFLVSTEYDAIREVLADNKRLRAKIDAALAVARRLCGPSPTIRAVNEMIEALRGTSE